MIQLKKQNKKAFFLGGFGAKKNKAQSTIEYAMVIICIVAALAAMRVYIKRGIQGRMRQSADSIGEQYAPKNTSGNSTINYTSNTITNVETLSEKQLTEKYGYPVDLDEDGIIEDDVFATETMVYIPEDKPSITRRTGSENVGSLESSLF